MKDIAQKGIEAGTNYITDKIGGTGIIHKTKRIVGRRVIGKKKSNGGSGSGCCVSSGGALFPAGFSG